VAKPLRPFEDTSLDKPFVWKVQGTDSPYQRQGIEVVAFSALEAMQKARRRWNLNTGGTPEQEFFRLNGWIATPVREAPATADDTATDTDGNWGIWINALDRFANEPGSYSPGQTPTSMRFPASQVSLPSLALLTQKCNMNSMDVLQLRLHLAGLHRRALKSSA
jgi:hypothetical protein